MWGDTIDREILRRLINAEGLLLGNRRRLDALLGLSNTANRREIAMAATLQDILDKSSRALTTATNAATLTSAIKIVLDAEVAKIADLQARLDEAIASGDMAKVQEISDNMDALIAAQDSDAAAKAILAGTPPGTGDL